MSQMQIERLAKEVEGLTTLLDNMQREKDMQRLEISRLRKAMALGNGGGGGGGGGGGMNMNQNSAMLPALSGSLTSGNNLNAGPRNGSAPYQNNNHNNNNNNNSNSNQQPNDSGSVGNRSTDSRSVGGKNPFPTDDERKEIRRHLIDSRISRPDAPKVVMGGGEVDHLKQLSLESGGGME
jgi:hypothetical protein